RRRSGRFEKLSSRCFLHLSASPLVSGADDSGLKAGLYISVASSFVREKHVGRHDEGKAVGRAGRRFLEERAPNDVGVSRRELQLRSEWPGALDIELFADMCGSRTGGDSRERCAAGGIETVGLFGQPPAVNAGGKGPLSYWGQRRPPPRRGGFL